MTTADFKTTISEAWTALGLPAPRFGNESVMNMSADTREVILQETRDGEHLLITCQVMTLSQEADERASQIRRILSSTLAYLPSHKACISLAKDASDGPPIIVVQAVHSYGPGQTDLLLGLLEDVLSLTDDLGVDLPESGLSLLGSTEPVAVKSEMYNSESMLFRP